MEYDTFTYLHFCHCENQDAVDNLVPNTPETKSRQIFPTIVFLAENMLGNGRLNRAATKIIPPWIFMSYPTSERKR